MMKHLLRKNGTRRTLKVEDNVQCEKLLNNLAKQHKQQQSTIENSSPPSKRQTFVVNENIPVVIADTLSGLGTVLFRSSFPDAI